MRKMVSLWLAALAVGALMPGSGAEAAMVLGARSRNFDSDKGNAEQLVGVPGTINQASENHYWWGTAGVAHTADFTFTYDGSTHVTTYTVAVNLAQGESVPPPEWMGSYWWVWTANSTISYDMDSLYTAGMPAIGSLSLEAKAVTESGPVGLTNVTLNGIALPDVVAMPGEWLSVNVGSPVDLNAGFTVAGTIEYTAMTTDLSPEVAKVGVYANAVPLPGALPTGLGLLGGLGVAGMMKRRQR